MHTPGAQEGPRRVKNATLRGSKLARMMPQESQTNGSEKPREATLENQTNYVLCVRLGCENKLRLWVYTSLRL